MWLQCAVITAVSETDPKLDTLMRQIYPANLCGCRTTTGVSLQRHADTAQQMKKMCTLCKRADPGRAEGAEQHCFFPNTPVKKPLVFLRVDRGQRYS